MGSISKVLKATGVFLVTVFLVMIPFQIFNVLLVRNGTTATSLDSTVRGEMIVALIVAFFVSRKYWRRWSQKTKDESLLRPPRMP
jgi:hypothetical protein